MKKTFLVIFLVAIVLASGQAGAVNHFTQNEFTVAENLDPGMTQTGIHYTVGDHYTSYYPEIRYGLGSLLEGGVKFGVSSVDTGSENKVAALAGIDIKYQMVKETEGIPLDMALDLGFDNTILNGKNVSEVTFSTIVSKGFPLTERGYKFIPYGGLEMSSIYGSYLSTNDTSVYLIGGVQWKLTQKFMLMAEIKGGANVLAGFGIRFEY